MELSRVDGVEKMHGEDNPQEKPKKVKKPKARTPKNEDSEPSKKEVRNGMKSGFSLHVGETEDGGTSILDCSTRKQRENASPY